MHPSRLTERAAVSGLVLYAYTTGAGDVAAGQVRGAGGQRRAAAGRRAPTSATSAPSPAWPPRRHDGLMGRGAPVAVVDFERAAALAELRAAAAC